MTTEIDKRILEFIREHHVLTLATSDEGRPWCSSMFYVFIEEEQLFVFTSEDKTRHIAEARKNYRVAGSIALETKIVGRIRGIQFCGEIFQPDGELLAVAKKMYLKRFPIAHLSTLHLWVVSPDLIKMTDNRLGFGKKLYWERGKSSGEICG
ncbi:MAG: pyridoxamine 5'-phosphate oxidase family protein [Bacteroidetes bacterium]|nr:pyridoxamine 5'-phosphate oxidase family protein [Bacteroidota bacterium]MBU1719946.1 pyridoxamine 5'-phosphate oxidase family protein [Bacteroidota bacterium]